MIKKETAAKIWNCYSEIEKSEALINEMNERKNRGEDPNPRDPFGRQRCLQLGVPSGESSHQIYDLQPALAIAVIEAHIAAQRAALAAANEQARHEVAELPPPNS